MVTDKNWQRRAGRFGVLLTTLSLLPLTAHAADLTSLTLVTTQLSGDTETLTVAGDGHVTVFKQGSGSQTVQGMATPAELAAIQQALSSANISALKPPAVMGPVHLDLSATSGGQSVKLGADVSFFSQPGLLPLTQDLTALENRIVATGEVVDQQTEVSGNPIETNYPLTFTSSPASTGQVVKIDISSKGHVTVTRTSPDQGNVARVSQGNLTADEIDSLDKAVDVAQIGTLPAPPAPGSAEDRFSLNVGTWDPTLATKAGRPIAYTATPPKDSSGSMSGGTSYLVAHKDRLSALNQTLGEIASRFNSSELKTGGLDSNVDNFTADGLPPPVSSARRSAAPAPASPVSMGTGADAPVSSGPPVAPPPAPLSDGLISAFGKLP
jgi:hypothetical protein